MKRKILFSWFAAERIVPNETDKRSVTGEHICNFPDLVRLLALHLGIYPFPVDNNIRIIKYMHGLEKVTETTFFKTLYEQDPVVTARFLLKQRDDLRWYFKDFSELESIGGRLKDLYYAESATDPAEIRGIPDIYWEVISSLERGVNLPISIELFEYEALYPPYARMLFRTLATMGTVIKEPPLLLPGAEKGTNLRLFQAKLLNLLNNEKPENTPFTSGDSSLILHKPRYATDAGQELLALMEKESDSEWYFLRRSNDVQIAEAVRHVKGTESAMNSEVVSLSLTQVIKAFCNLLWKPMDVEVVYEFLNLPVKPFPGKLARELGKALLEAPGVKSSTWQEKVSKYRESLTTTNEETSGIDKKKILQYNWWFEQELFDPAQGIDLSVFASRISWLHNWANKRANADGAEDIAGQLKEFCNICIEINALAEILVKDKTLSRANLDKLLKLVLENRSLKSQRYSQFSAGFLHDVNGIHEEEKLFWGDFSKAWEDFGVSDFLWNSEKKELVLKGISVFSQKGASLLQRHAQVRKILNVKERLILSHPAFEGTTYNAPHSFWLFLESLPEDMNVGNLRHAHLTDNMFDRVSPLPLEKIEGLVTVEGLDSLLPLPKESYSSISKLLFYPHSYVFVYVLELPDNLKSALSLDAMLKGKIVHRFTEMALLDESLMGEKINSGRWREWCRSNMPAFFEKEAGILLKSKFAVDRIAMESLLTNQLFKLFEGISEDGWTVESVEDPFAADLDDFTKIRGRSDLILAKGENRFIVDLKSGGASYKEDEIKGNSDWQLLLYSHFAGKGYSPSCSAFFILRNGTFIGRHDPGIRHFKEVRPKADKEIPYPEMLALLRKAMKERIDQLKRGEIEFRLTKEAIETLPDNLKEEFSGINMKQEPDRFENYQFLNTL